MRETEQFSSLIGEVYDAALDPGRWPGALGKLRAFVGGQAAVICHKDAASRCGCADYQDGGLDTLYVQLYFDKYIRLDPFSTSQFFAEVGEAVAIADLIPPDEILETRFYTEWIQPQGLVDCIVSPLDKSRTSAALVGVFRHERDGPADDETRRRLRLIVPHLRRAVLIGNVIDLKTTEAATFADTLDSITAATLFVDARGRIVHANASGHAILAEGSILRADGGKLAARDAGAERALHDAFHSAGNGDARLGSKGIAVLMSARDGGQWAAHVLPLTSGARRRSGTAYAAVAAVFVRKAAVETRSPLETIARHYKLTPSELRVLVGVVEVGGVRETAEALGLGEATVKTHLNRLFTKTGTSRQADLVKLVAGLSSPLAG
jgi:DNA-binding CsgD family transcriptional regulator